MKTAEEYTENSGMACEYGYSVIVMPVCDVLIVMKQYAKEVAQQALKDAYDNHELDYTPSKHPYREDVVSLLKESIIYIPINTP